MLGTSTGYSVMQLHRSLTPVLAAVMEKQWDLAGCGAKTSWARNPKMQLLYDKGGK